MLHTSATKIDLLIKYTVINDRKCNEINILKNHNNKKAQ